jgi:hypothetical protein
MYDSTIGRWINLDPIGFDAGDANPQRYVRNDPTNVTDPSGMAERKPFRGRTRIRPEREAEVKYDALSNLMLWPVTDTDRVKREWEDKLLAACRRRYGKDATIRVVGFAVTESEARYQMYQVNPGIRAKYKMVTKDGGTKDLTPPEREQWFRLDEKEADQLAVKHFTYKGHFAFVCSVRQPDGTVVEHQHLSPTVEIITGDKSGGYIGHVPADKAQLDHAREKLSDMVEEAKRELVEKYRDDQDFASIECVATDVCDYDHLSKFVPGKKKYEYVDFRGEPTKDGDKYSRVIGPNRAKIEAYVKRWPILDW